MVVQQQQQQQTLCLALCLLLVLAAQSNSQNTHGLTYQKNPGKASPAMAAFFGRPKATELPEARNVSDPVWSAAAAKAAPDHDSSHDSSRHARPALLISTVVFGVLGIGLLVAAAVAYVLHARRSRARSSSNPLVGLTDWSA